MNNSGYKRWKDEVVATLYVKPSSGELNRNTNNAEDPTTSSSSSSIRLGQRWYVKEHEEGPSQPSPPPPPSSSSPSLETEDVKDESKVSSSEMDMEGDFSYYSYYSSGEANNNEDNSSNDNDDTRRRNDEEDDNGENQIWDNKRRRSFGKSRNKQRISGTISSSPTSATTMTTQALRNSKNKLPYALRGDRPHYKFEDYQQEQQQEGGTAAGDGDDTNNNNNNSGGVFVGSSYTEKVDSFIPEQEQSHSFLHRWKRHVLSPTKVSVNSKESFII